MPKNNSNIISGSIHNKLVETAENISSPTKTLADLKSYQAWKKSAPVPFQRVVEAALKYSDEPKLDDLSPSFKSFYSSFFKLLKNQQLDPNTLQSSPAINNF